MNRDTYEMLNRLQSIGIDYNDALAIRRCAMTLNRWNELECGTDSGAVERDEETGKTYWVNAMTGKRWPTPDRETGAVKRLNVIMARYPQLSAYLQGDPRGASVYILQPGDVPAGCGADAYYSRGIAVFK